MKRMPRRASVLRRLEELEVRVTDGSGLAPHSLPWFEFWQGEFDKFDSGQDYQCIPLEAMRAIMQAAPDYEAEPCQ